MTEKNSDNFKIIDDKMLIKFVKKNMTKGLRKAFDIRFPLLGKNRGKMLIPYPNYSPLTFLYISFIGYGFMIGGDEILGIDP